jgi:hypothetical protein
MSKLPHPSEWNLFLFLVGNLPFSKVYKVTTTITLATHVLLKGIGTFMLERVANSVYCL